MMKDKKVADYTCILPTMLCIAKKKKKQICPQGHIRAQGSAHTAGFQPIRLDELKGNLMNTGDSLTHSRPHKPAAY